MRFICDVPALNVKFVLIVKLTGVKMSIRVIVLLPNEIVLTPLPDELNVSAVTAKLAVLNVPAVIVNVPPRFNELPKATVPPAPD